MTITPELHAQIVETHTICTELRKRLLGNGQPGEIDKIKSRIVWLEKITWTGIGTAAAVASAAGWAWKFGLLK